MANGDRSGVSAIVLAAGSSTRMGTVKPLVPVHGKSMLERVLSTLRQSRVDEIVVVLGHSAELIRQSVALDDAVVVINDRFRTGMASSLQTGLASVSSHAEAALIVLADQPFLKPGTVDRLIHDYLRDRPEIVIPMFQGSRGNPVLLDRSVFREVDLLEGDVGFRAIFGQHAGGTLKVAVDDAGILMDLDTLSDVHKIEQAGIEPAH